ncbi:MAG: LmeA family phospholipid-binding protein [Prosthecobacter sp.]
MQTYSESPAAVAPAAPRARSTKKVILITLAVILGCAGIAAATTAYWVKHTFYPSPITPVSLTATEQAEFDGKLRALSDPSTIPPDEVNRTILLTEREVNAYLAEQQLGETVQVKFGNGNVSAAIILTAPEDFPVAPNRKIRVRFTFGTSLTPEHKLSLQLDDLSLGGISLPNSWLGDIKGVDLVAENVESDPALQKFLAGIQSLDIRDGAMKLVLNK